MGLLKIGDAFIRIGNGYLAIGPFDGFPDGGGGGGIGGRVLILLTQTRDADLISLGERPVVSGDLVWEFIGEATISVAGDRMCAFWALAPSAGDAFVVAGQDTPTSLTLDAAGSSVVLTTAADQVYIIGHIYSVNGVDIVDPIVQHKISETGTIAGDITTTYDAPFANPNNISFTGGVGRLDAEAVDPATVDEHEVIPTGGGAINAIAFKRNGEPTNDEVIWRNTGDIGNDDQTIAIELRVAGSGLALFAHYLDNPGVGTLSITGSSPQTPGFVAVMLVKTTYPPGSEPGSAPVPGGDLTWNLIDSVICHNSAFDTSWQALWWAELGTGEPPNPEITIDTGSNGVLINGVYLEANPVTPIVQVESETDRLNTAPTTLTLPSATLAGNITLAITEDDFNGDVTDFTNLTVYFWYKEGAGITSVVFPGFQALANKHANFAVELNRS